MHQENATRQSIPQVKPWLGVDEEFAVAQVLRRGWLTEGRSCDEFSDRLNHLMGARYGVFAPNGTLALALGLLALGIGPGDEVLVPDITFAGSATAAILVGARPVFVDVEAGSYQIDTACAAMRVSAATRAIMPVHLYGSACDMHAVLSFAAKHSLRVIEDAAQAIGVHFDGRHAGVIGDVGCFSFFADKTLTTGEGGYVVCSDERLYERLRQLRNQGRLDRGSFIHPTVGFNFRITDLQAAIGIAQLHRLTTIMERKREIHERYEQRLRDIPQVKFLNRHSLSTHVPFRVVLIAEHAQRLTAWLTDRHVQCRTFFYPLHRQPCFAGATSTCDTFPVADHGFAHGLCLPVYPTLTHSEIDYICDAIHEFYRLTPRSTSNDRITC